MALVASIAAIISSKCTASTEVALEPPDDPSRTSTFLILRVADIQEVYEEWSVRGAEFLIPPVDRGAEIRCYIRDPDGHLIEVGQATGFLEGLEDGGRG